MILVVDASVAIKWFELEADSDKAAELLASEHLLIAPSHALGEIGEALTRQAQKGSISRDQVEAALIGLQGSLVFVPLQELLSEATAIALEANTSFYDALYVAAAIVWNCKLVTSDGKLLGLLAGTKWAGHAIRLADVESAK